MRHKVQQRPANARRWHIKRAVPVAGTRHYEDNVLEMVIQLSNSDDDMPVFLKRQPFNKFDRNAIAVMVRLQRDVTWFAQTFLRRKPYIHAQIGHVPAEYTKQLAKDMKYGLRTTVGIWQLEADEDSLGYWVKIAIFEAE